VQIYTAWECQLADQASQGLLSPFLQNQRVKAARPYLKGRVLDIGCGNGMLAEYCDPNTYYGFDIDEATIAAARSAHPRFRFERALPGSGMRFDTVVGLAIIEHLSDPPVHLRTWRDFLKSDGAIVLTTPHPRMEWVHQLGSRIGIFSHGAAEEHEDLIDLNTMKGLVAQAELVVAKYQRFLFGANQIFVLGVGGKS